MAGEDVGEDMWLRVREVRGGRGKVHRCRWKGKRSNGKEGAITKEGRKEEGGMGRNQKLATFLTWQHGIPPDSGV